MGILPARDAEQQDLGLNVRKFLVPRSDTPLCLEVIGDFWNELLFKELFFLKSDKTKILADY